MAQCSKVVLIIIMFIGACAGSTGGGIKVSRVIMMLKSVKRELNAYLHPKSVRTIKMEGKALNQGAISSVAVYFITFTLIFATSFLLVSLEGRDLTTNFTAVLTTMNNMGPGLADVGPSRNFGELSVLSKYVLMFVCWPDDWSCSQCLFYSILYCGKKHGPAASGREDAAGVKKERLQSKYKISAIVGRHKDVRRRPGRRDK